MVFQLKNEGSLFIYLIKTLTIIAIPTNIIIFH